MLHACKRFFRSTWSGKDYKTLAYIPRALTDVANMQSDTLDRTKLRNMLQLNSWSIKAQSLLLSFFYELESEIIDNLNSDLSVPIYAVGPLVPHMTLSVSSPIETADTKYSYFKWLDSQPSCSVLYISLGSFLSVSTAQVDEMVMGLDASGARYLWVTRDEHLQSKELGTVVPWCDQLRVLCHPSVGGFLTHCGWNSTLEGVYAGVPMLTYPLIWDQYPNCKRIVDDWRIGLRLNDEGAEGVTGRERVAKMVRELMDLEAEETMHMRKRSAELKEKCRKAVGEGGSSSTSLDAFVQEMIAQKESISASSEAISDSSSAV